MAREIRLGQTNRTVLPPLNIPDGHVLHVVAVDDHKPLLSVISKIITRDIPQSNVYTFSEVRDARDWLKHNYADLIICDLFFPDESGYDLLESVRDNDFFKDVPFLIISGEDNREDVIHALELGATDYLVKPFEKGTVVNKVITALNQRFQPDKITKKYIHLEELVGEGDYKTALFEVEKLLEVKKTARALVFKAQVLLKLDKLEEAQSAINEAISENPLYYQAYAVESDVYLKKNDIQKTIKSLKKELTINSKKLKRRILLSELYFETGKKVEALAELRACLRDFPGDESIYFKYSRMLKDCGNRPAALQYILKARRRHPRSFRALLELIQHFEEENDLFQALEVLDDLVHRHSDQSDIFLARSKVNEKIKRYNDALDDLNLISSENIHLYEEILETKLRVLNKKKDYKKIIPVSIEKARFLPSAKNNAFVAYSYIELEDYAEASNWYKKAIEKDETNYTYYYNLAHCYEKQRNYSKAMEIYEIAYKLSPKSIQVLQARKRMKAMLRRL
jgi:DNA-binding response OmpR family regulator